MGRSNGGDAVSEAFLGHHSAEIEKNRSNGGD
jgi:hypothetical protein